VPGVTVLVADDRLEAIDVVAAALQDAGLRLGDVLPAAGAITGSVDDLALLPVLEAVEGVDAVEPEQEIQLPSPDEPIQ
jgi:CheY-like chemotaxis protein